MKTAGYESCYAAIMGAKLEQPHTYPAFTEYFDVEALDSIRAAYGVDLYNECLKDATAAIERERDTMKELTIDGLRLGRCISYRNTTKHSPVTGDDLGHFAFLMEAGYTVTVEKLQIKTFTSCNELKIELYRKERTA